MISAEEASKHDAQAEQELAKAAAAISEKDRKLHLDAAAQHATLAELVRRQISSCE